MKKNALVIGATGLLGLGVANELYRQGWEVRAIGRSALLDTSIFVEGIEYLRGDFYDEGFLTAAFKGVDTVFFFLSSSFPSTCNNSLELEISQTLMGLDYLLRKMRENEINKLVFPSSGGTIYGNIERGKAKEDDPLRPGSSYAVGKVLCEQIIEYYSQFGISATILRVGNVYGTPLARKTSQGVIDVYVQKALLGERAVVWGNAINYVRDYIFIDDFSKAVAKIVSLNQSGINVYNLGSGQGTTLKEIVYIINKYSEKPLDVSYVSDDVTSSIKRVVLDMFKFENLTGWKAEYDIEQGIVKTIERKSIVLGLK